MADDSHDLNYKMSKKIAQLTKVIYQLNCRNEDNDATIRTVADRYETEIAEIMSDAKTKITTLRDTLATKNDKAQLEIIVKELTSRHQKEKEDAMRLFDEFKTNTLRNEGNAKHKYEEGLLNAAREVTAAKEQFAAALESIRSQQQKSATSKDGELADLRKLKEKEMNELVTEYNERYKAMMAEQMDAQDKLERDLNQQWQKRLDALNADKGGALSDLVTQLDKERALVALTQKERDATRSELEAAKKAIAEHLAVIGMLKQREASLNSGASELGDEISKANALVDSLKGKVSHLEGKLEVSEAQHAKASADLDQAQLVINRQTSDITSHENTISVLEAKVAKLLGELEDGAKSRGEQATSSDAKLQEMKSKSQALEGQLATALSQLSASQASNTDLTNALKASQAELQALRVKYDADVADLKARHEKDLAGAQSNASSSSASLADAHKAALATLRQEHVQATAAAKSAADKELDELKSKHSTAISGANKKLEEVTGDYENKISALQGDKAQLETQISALQKDIEKMRQEISNLKKQLELEGKGNNESMTALIAKHETALKEAMDKLRLSSEATLEAASKKHAEETKALQGQFQSEKASLEANQRKAQAEHESLIASLRRQHEEELAANLRSQGQDANARHNTELSKLKKELSDQLERQRTLAEKELSDKIRELTSKMNAEAQLAASKIRSLEEALSMAQEQSASNKESLGGELSALRNKMEAEALSHKNLLAHVTATLTSDSQAAMDEASHRHREEKKALEEELAGLKASHELQLGTLGDGARQAQRDIEESYKNRLASLEKRKDEEMAKKLADMKASYEAQLSALAETASKQEKAYAAANSKLSTEVAALSSTIASTNQTLTTTSQELTQALERLREAEDAAIQQGRAHVVALSEQKRSLEIDRNQAIATVHAQHQSEAEAALEAFEAERTDFQGKIKQLKRVIADLEYKYANRESRAEDVEKINAILKELRTKDDALLKAYNDMKFYKLELENREESFNKMFGRQPVLASADTTKPVAPSSAPPPKSFGADMGGPRSRVKSLK